MLSTSNQLVRTATLAIATVWSAAALAQIPTTNGTPSLTAQIEEKARHIREFSNLIQSNTESIRLAAMQAAMKDPDASVRQMALSTYLLPYSSLTPEIILARSSSVAQDDVPPLAIVAFRWSDDGRTFDGAVEYSVAFGCGSGASSVAGQVAGGKLSINFRGVCFKAEMVSTRGQSTNGNKGVMTSCQVTMAPTLEGDMLEGPLHCAGVASSLTVRLPFGS